MARKKMVTASDVNAQVEHLRYQLDASIAGMSRVRDSLRALIDEAEDYDADLSEAIESMEEARDALSRLV